MQSSQARCSAQFCRDNPQQVRCFCCLRLWLVAIVQLDMIRCCTIGFGLMRNCPSSWQCATEPFLRSPKLLLLGQWQGWPACSPCLTGSKCLCLRFGPCCKKQCFHQSVLCKVPIFHPSFSSCMACGGKACICGHPFVLGNQLHCACATVDAPHVTTTLLDDPSAGHFFADSR